MRQTTLVSEPLQTERLSNGRRILLRDLTIRADSKEWNVPEGTNTDYSTIPAIGRAVVRWSRVDLAGVVHDWLYGEAPSGISRARADRIWRLIAMAGKHRANWVQGHICWLALRAYGGLAWASYRKTRTAWILAIAQAGLTTIFLLAGIAAFLAWFVPLCVH